MRLRSVSLFMLLALCAMLIAGCASSVPAAQSSDITKPKAVEGQPSQIESSDNNSNQASDDKMFITVYRATNDALYLVPEVHVLPRNDHPAKTAIELLLSAPTKSEVVSPVPQGTKLRRIAVKDHIAYVDFNEKIIKNNIGGSTSEMLLIGAIVNTLTEFPEIEKVQILVEGKHVETISGHVDISEPMSRSEHIIKK